MARWLMYLKNEQEHWKCFHIILPYLFILQFSFTNLNMSSQE